jgi:ribosomal protein S18 acetylase RimI-like enzyme
MRIRAMTEADVDAVAAIRVTGWQTAYRGIVPQSFLDAMDAAEDAAQRRQFLARSAGRVHNFVAVDGTGAADGAAVDGAEAPSGSLADGSPADGSSATSGEVVGWVAFGPYRSADVPDGSAELYALYVRPDRIGTGVGRALMSTALTRTRSLGVRHLLLWVLAGNDRARRFYARSGFAPDGAVTVDDCEGVPLKEMRYARDL